MDTHSNSVDFTVEFTQTYEGGTTERIRVEHFVNEINAWNEDIHSYTIIRENINLKLTFNCREEDARCSMDGFDIINDELLQYDEKNTPFIRNGTLTLYKHHSEYDYYPYIPGIYCISVIRQGKEYFSFVKVISNRLTDSQLQSMRIEVENQLKGLALDVVRKQNVFQNFEELTLDKSLVQQFKILDYFFTDISTIIADLTKRVRSSLKKEYILQSVEKPSHVDTISIQYRLKHPESTNYLKTRKNLVNYDLPENRLLKQIINKWVRLLVEFIQQVEYSLKKYQENKEIFSSYTSKGRRKDLLTELESYRTRASQIKGSLDTLRVSHWYQEVLERGTFAIPNNMHMDVRYNKILKIHKYLFSQEVDFSLHPRWSFHWKRTDQLYEIWSFLKVVKIFISNHYKLSHEPSWLLNGSDFELDNLIVIPTIPKGATFELQKNDLNLKIVYGGEIPKEQSKTDQENSPIYTTSDHNTPDLRVDVYIRNIYIGTILMDSKYRKRQVLMDSKYQLISYADHVRSPFIYNKRRWERIRPVYRVMVLYPDKRGSNGIEHLDEKSISLVPLTPESDFEELGQFIDKLINEMVLDAEDEGIC